MTISTLKDNDLFQTGFLVNGKWQQAASTFEVLNPATGEVVAACLLYTSPSPRDS